MLISENLAARPPVEAAQRLRIRQAVESYRLGRGLPAKPIGEDELWSFVRRAAQARDNGDDGGAYELLARAICEFTAVAKVAAIIDAITETSSAEREGNRL